MRLILLILICFCSYSALAQNDSLAGILPRKDGRVLYTASVEAPGLSKDEVFRRARRWWVYTYKSAKDVLQVSDDKAGELIGKGWMYREFEGKRRDEIIRLSAWHTLSFQAKEGGYDIRVSDIKVSTNRFAEPEPVEIFKASEKKYPRVMAGADECVRTIMASLNQYVLTEKQ